MKVFISWSGFRSKQVATALRDWLPLVLHFTSPWMSDIDIPAGDRWSAEIGEQLQDTHFGIICLTKENLASPWVLFEAGALAKSLSSGAVCPYLLDLDISDIGGPLSQFQAKKANKDETYELIQSINQRAEKPRPTKQLEILYEDLWPRLDAKLNEVPESQAEPGPIRSEKEVLEELVSTVRSLEQGFHKFEEFTRTSSKAQQEKLVNAIHSYEQSLESLKQTIQTNQTQTTSYEQDPDFGPEEIPF